MLRSYGGLQSIAAAPGRCPDIHSAVCTCGNRAAELSGHVTADRV